MILEVNNRYFSVINLDDDLGDVYYSISVFDTSDNFLPIEGQISETLDNDPPLGNDTSNAEGTTGDPYEIIILAFDNIEIKQVLVYWEHGQKTGGGCVEHAARSPRKMHRRPASLSGPWQQFPREMAGGA